MEEIKNVNNIPERYHEFAREVVLLARKYELTQFNMKLRPPLLIGRDWDSDIDIWWEQGRHGEASKRFGMSSTVRVSGDIEENVKHEAFRG